MLPWYALFVVSRKETCVSQSLQGKGYQVFLPIYVNRRKVSNRIRTLEQPLFPNYVFCRLDVRDRLPVLTTTGVLSVVGHGRTPMPIQSEEIDQIKRILASGRLVDPLPFLTTGQRVRLVDGPLAGTEGHFQEHKGSGRLVVTVDLLQRSISVELDREHVEPVEPLQFIKENPATPWPYIGQPALSQFSPHDRYSRADRRS
jgi:transcription antitermination factor NusG